MEQFGLPTSPVMDAAFTIDPPGTPELATRMLRSSADMQLNVP
jgi:hypothetical protein